MRAIPSSPLERFNNPAVVTQSWYMAAPARDIGRGQARSYELLGRRIALYRTRDGRLHALDARCAHIGADLGMGQVVGNELQCPFHHWRYGPDGACRHAPGLAQIPARSLRAYPTLERWGLIWIFNGPRPLFELPDAPPGERCWHIRLRSRHIACHPHLAIANGMDATHFETLHDMQFTAPPRLTMPAPGHVAMYIQGKPRSLWMQRLTGTRDRDIQSTFTAFGGNLAWTTVESPLRFHILFSGRPSPAGGCQTQVVFLIPRGTGWRCVRVAFLMYALLHDDTRILEHLDFGPGFTEADAGLRAFVQVVNAMDTY
jgi:phenylpropionate dioxygenase-like ring-hydroxylating dioxygenase large terminal subunit